MLVPLKPNFLSVSPSTANLGETIELEVLGYNTSFLGVPAGAVRGWLRAGEDLSLEARSVEIIDDRRARLTFDLPAFLPDTVSSLELPLIMTSPEDGAFVDPRALTVRQPTPPNNLNDARQAWTATSMKSGDLHATPRITYPFRGLLMETIRNTYFHVSLWFAMIILFVVAVVQAVKHLRRQTSTEALPTVVTLREKADLWSVAFTSVGMLFGILGLTTGALWAKYTWGSYWNWDIKQFTTLIALLIYAGYFVLRASFPDPEQRGRLSAAYNIFAFACLIPLIYILPRLSGNSLHPGAAGNPAFGGEDLDNTMRMVFYPIIIGWTLFGTWMATLSYRARLLRQRLDLSD
ncbi:cytochrome c assembly protein [Lewinella sp. W8]|nr:cytochrome c assembly protein [Lewinella sp. W8]